MQDNNTEIQDWQNQISLAKEYKEKYADSKKWKLWTNMYRNDYKPGVLPVNQIFSVGRTLIPRVYFRNPRIVVTPTSPDMWVQSRIVESLDNWLLTRIGMKKQIKRIILDSYLYGTGIGKSGYDSEYGYDQEETRTLSDYEQELQNEGYPIRDEDRIEYDTNIIPGMPWYKRTHPNDIFMPWGVLEIGESPWIVHRFLRHIDDVKADKKYSNTDDLNATHRSKAIDNKSLSQSALTERFEDSFVELWEVYDMKKSKVRVYATGHNKWLREDDLLLDQLPFDSLIWNENPDAFWGISDCKMLEPQQKELNEIRTQYQQHRKMSLLKLIVTEGSLSDEAKEALVSGDVAALVEVADEVDKNIKIMKPYLSNDLLLAAQEIKKDIRENVGFSRNAMGEYDSSSRRTAYEASVVNQATQIRIDERRDVTADLLVSAVKKFNQYIFEYWSQPKVAKILGMPDASQWIQFTGEQIRGDYNLVIDPDTAKAVSSERRKQEAMQYANWALQFAQASPQTFNLQEIAKHVTKQFDGVPEKIINTQQMPMGQSPMSIQGAQANMKQQGGGQDANLQALLSEMSGGV